MRGLDFERSDARRGAFASDAWCTGAACVGGADGFRGRGEEAIYRFGPLEVYILDHVVTRYGEPIRLAPTTFEILSLLVRNMGRLVPYQQFIHPPSGKH